MKRKRDLDRRKLRGAWERIKVRVNRRGGEVVTLGIEKVQNINDQSRARYFIQLTRFKMQIAE